MSGTGISAKIRNAYSFLSHNYNFVERNDEIILVGFSRGAFAAQCLASFISQTGLLQKQHLYYLRGLFTLWAYQEVTGGSEKLKEETQRLKRVLFETKITACAVWDTVATLGIATQLPPRPLSFVGKQVPKGVLHAFQALALDEERPKFKPTVWQTMEGNTDVSQCWFLGSHGDVGGNADAALGAVTLLWMIGKLQDRVGVAFEEDEIGKHLKHKFLEWDFSVNEISATFKEILILSHLPHEGKILLLSRQPLSPKLMISAHRQADKASLVLAVSRSADTQPVSPVDRYRQVYESSDGDSLHGRPRHGRQGTWVQMPRTGVVDANGGSGASEQDTVAPQSWGPESG